MKRFFVPLAVAGAIACAPTPAFAEDSLLPDPGTCAHEDGGSLPQQEAAARCLIDAVRANDDATDVTWTAQLNKSADLKLARMISCEDFGHTPCGDSAFASFTKAGYYNVKTYKMQYGESIAYGGTPRETVNDWLGSPAHRRILLSDAWTGAGISVAIVKDYEETGEDTPVWVFQGALRVRR